MDFSRAINRMVDEQIVARGIRDSRVISAMREIPRHLFVEEALQGQAYNDYPLPIGHGQTISQPYMVALMTEALELKGNEKVLEIGTGSGYQTAILAKLAEKVYSIERISELATRARKILDQLNCYNVEIRIFDGTYGWKEKSPFDGIIVTAGAPDIPQPLLDQLAPGGRLVIPVGETGLQDLFQITRKDREIIRKNLGGCRFVRLIGRYGWEGGR
ncbi:MAG: protein-L-isoaspartate(D-aspartate) O-methyltransferase [Deltaproteobacteria bacterium]|nr:protein-L-isoaspartate(D-aspartate) O-methyltransferase [Deltaproteobacteria bacterium]MBW2121423.1 protein-L-isoaspartate(D-aspartate) O-methyltransferase [Deltaproteobacteria bacterium]